MDLVGCRHVLEHIARPLEMLLDLRRSIKDRVGAIVVFEVPNMHCEHCVQTIGDALEKKGVEVAADLERHRLEVTLSNGAVTPEGVREMLTELGFKPAERVQAPQAD